MTRLYRKSLFAAVLGTALFGAAGAALAQDDFSGRWDTNMGSMFIQQGIDHVSGRYEMKGGRIEGDVNRNTLTGIWTQDNADHRCFETRMGSHYWGRFRLHLNHDGDRFSGRWSYCDDEPGTGGNWTGERHHRRTRGGRY